MISYILTGLAHRAKSLDIKGKKPDFLKQREIFFVKLNDQPQPQKFLKIALNFEIP